MNRRFYLSALASSLLATPAFATPQEDAACVVGRLAAADHVAIVSETALGNSAETVTRLNPPLDACSAGRNWTPDRRANAAGYTIGLVVSSEMRHRLGAHGIDAAALDRWFARQSDEFRANAFITMPRADLEAAFATMVGHEVSAEAMDRDGESIGSYVSALVIMERIGRGLGL